MDLDIIGGGPQSFLFFLDKNKHDRLWGGPHDHLQCWVLLFEVNLIVLQVLVRNLPLSTKAVFTSLARGSRSYI